MSSANNVQIMELNKELSKYISEFDNYTPTEKFQAIMSSKEAGVINALGIFLNHVLELNFYFYFLLGSYYFLKSVYG